MTVIGLGQSGIILNTIITFLKYLYYYISEVSFHELRLKIFSGYSIISERLILLNIKYKNKCVGGTSCTKSKTEEVTEFRDHGKKLMTQ